MSTVRITVNGAPVEAERGSSVAVAMMNAGITSFRKSVSGEARVPLCAMGVCHECRVTIGGVGHQRSCLSEVAEGLVVETVPGLSGADSSPGEHMEASVVVIGAGPAGIAAAIIAAEQGARVIVLDENQRSGGQIWRHGPGSPAAPRARVLLDRLARTSAVVLHGSTVTHAQRDGERFIVTAERNGAPLEVSARHVVLATGARELFLPFPGSTLPNVIGIGALQALLKGGLDVRGKRVVIAGTGPLLLPVAAMSRAKGARLMLVAEQAPIASVLRFSAGLLSHPTALVQAAQYRAGFLSTPYRLGTWVTRATGGSTVERVELSDGANTKTIACDILAVAHGLIGNTELARLLGCAVENGAVQVDESLCTSVPHVYCAGEPTGVGGVDLAIAEGEIAGASCAGLAATPAQRRNVQRLRGIAERMHDAFALRSELKALALGDTIVCRCEDVRMNALRPGWSMRKAKLYTRAGMGACQGRTCGAALDYLQGSGADSVRAPIQPVRLSTLSAAPAATDPNHGERSDG